MKSIKNRLNLWKGNLDYPSGTAYLLIRNANTVIAKYRLVEVKFTEV